MNPRVPIEWFDACAAGIYLLFGVIHFDLWLRRRERMSHLWLAGASAGALLVDVTGILLRRGTASPGTLLPALNLLGVLLVTASIFELVRSLGGDRPATVARSFYAALAGLGVVIVVGARYALFPIFMLASGCVLFLAMLRAIRGARAGDPEARRVAAGLIVLVVALLLDIVSTTYGARVLTGLPIVGFVTLFVVSSRALSGRYEREYRELVELRNELEQRVGERTHALEDANRRLAEMSNTDSLTGLPNRRAFLKASEREVQAARSGQHSSVVMVDLDHFKQVNDRHGHAAGDATLKAAAASLRSILRPEDLIARWGGEEFILFLPDTDAHAALALAEKARLTLAGDVHPSNGSEGCVTGSFGIAVHRDDRTLESTIAAADHALYRAKEAGRNCVAVEA